MLKLTPFPHILIYTDSLNGFAGKANGPIVRVDRAYKDDMGLEKHEAEHVKQWWLSFGLHSFLLVLKRYRRYCEIAAYREQLKYPPATENTDYCKQRYAEFLATKYGLGITIDEAYKLLWG